MRVTLALDILTACMIVPMLPSWFWAAHALHQASKLVKPGCSRGRYNAGFLLSWYFISRPDYYQEEARPWAMRHLWGWIGFLVPGLLIGVLQLLKILFD